MCRHPPRMPTAAHGNGGELPNIYTPDNSAPPRPSSPRVNLPLPFWQAERVPRGRSWYLVSGEVPWSLRSESTLALSSASSPTLTRILLPDSYSCGYRNLNLLFYGQEAPGPRGTRSTPCPAPSTPKTSQGNKRKQGSGDSRVVCLVLQRGEGAHDGPSLRQQTCKRLGTPALPFPGRKAVWIFHSNRRDLKKKKKKAPGSLLQLGIQRVWGWGAGSLPFLLQPRTGTDSQGYGSSRASDPSPAALLAEGGGRRSLSGAGQSPGRAPPARPKLPSRRRVRCGSRARPPLLPHRPPSRRRAGSRGPSTNHE